MDWQEVQNDSEETAEEGGWIVTFSDLMSLLLTFFILLFSFSTIQEQKFKQLIESLQSAFGVQQIPEAGTREGLEMLQREAEPTPEAIDELGALVEKELQEIKSEMEEFILKNKLAGKVNVQVDTRGAVITISDVVLFPPGSADFNPSASPILSKIVDLIRQFPYRVRVEGHTDNIPIHTAQFPSNWELSSARAAKIVRYFISRGIEPSRLSAEGFAEYRPIADNSTPEGRAKNRRVEIVYIRENMLKRNNVVSNMGVGKGDLGH